MDGRLYGWIFTLLYLIQFSLVQGQNEICHFYGLNADCRYRVDMICLSHITAEIDPCAHPISVTFKIKCSSPNVDFSYTFSSSDTQVSVPGYARQVFLQVKMKMKEDQVLNVEADIHVYGQPSADFLNHDVELAGYNEQCPGLNEAAKIALGVMGGLAFVVLCLVVALLYIRHKRRKKLQSRPPLVENSEGPGQSTPRNSQNFDYHVERNYVGNEQSVIANNAVNYREETQHNVMSNGVVVASGFNSGSTSQVPNNSINNRYSKQTDRQSPDHDQRNCNETEPQQNQIRYSDVLKTDQAKSLKISDC